MKRNFICIALFTAISSTGMAQTKKPVASKKPGTATGMKKTGTAATGHQGLKTLSDSASYALGNNIAQSLSKNMQGLNASLIVKGLQDAFNKSTACFNEETAMTILNNYASKKQGEGADNEIAAGKAFLEKNKQNPKVKTTASGLQYEVLQEGSGVKPTASDSVTCNYIGTLTDGTEFDNSYSRGEPLTIALGNVIKGWTEGIQLMSKGAKYKFYIPYTLGYGLRGAPPTIPGGATLVFEVELLDVKKPM